jgi:hypothetical protein
MVLRTHFVIASGGPQAIKVVKYKGCGPEEDPPARVLLYRIAGEFRRA